MPSPYCHGQRTVSGRRKYAIPHVRHVPSKSTVKMLDPLPVHPPNLPPSVKRRPQKCFSAHPAPAGIPSIDCEDCHDWPARVTPSPAGLWLLLTRNLNPLCKQSVIYIITFRPYSGSDLLQAHVTRTTFIAKSRVAPDSNLAYPACWTPTRFQDHTLTPSLARLSIVCGRLHLQ